MGFDFATRDLIGVAEKGFDFTFVDVATGKETDVVISLVGAGSRIHKQAAAKIDDYKNTCARTGKTPDAEHINALITELTAKCTTGWTNVADGKKEVPFSYEAALDMYTRYPILREPVFESIHNVLAQFSEK